MCLANVGPANVGIAYVVLANVGLANVGLAKVGIACLVLTTVGLDRLVTIGWFYNPRFDFYSLLLYFTFSRIRVVKSCKILDFAEQSLH